MLNINVNCKVKQASVIDNVILHDENKFSIGAIQHTINLNRQKNKVTL